MPCTPEAWPRAARLKRQRLIRPLFAHGRNDTSSISVGTVRLLYRTVPQHITGTSSPIQVGFAVRRQQTAVRRNTMRRVLRESFRTSRVRATLRAQPGHTLTVMVLCRSRSTVKNSKLRSDLLQALDILAASMQVRPGISKEASCGS